MSGVSNDPLHGVKLEVIVSALEKELGWENMGYIVNINCFKNNPTLKSSLKFLRRTPWARAKVEKLYIERIIQFNEGVDKNEKDKKIN
ncbi:VF530 family protein [Crocinitomicaceae bacterium]|nr:VF530 family protein [Crocinitomicaceae bacterium]|tara:strand:- start:226 stop:489 length:264 start_codon:yes stop_codon:yes gene_type:complete